MERTNEARTNEANEAVLIDEARPINGLERLRTAVQPPITNGSGILSPRYRAQRINEHGSTMDLYIPSTGSEQRPIDQREFTQRTDQAVRMLCSLFGGSTVYPTIGYWLNEAGILINERINVINVTTKPDLMVRHYDEVIDYMITNGRSWYQSTIAISIDGRMLLIDL